MGQLRWCLIVLLIVCACENTGPDVAAIYNDPPAVWIAAGPAEGSTVTSPVHFYWGGWDEDGRIDRFEYFLIENLTGTFVAADTVGVPWSPVIGNDSTFTLPPDSVGVQRASMVAAEALSFTFFIRAIDDQERRSREPSHRTFNVSLPSKMRTAAP